MSRFVCFLYSFKAVAKIVPKFVEEVEVEGVCDIGIMLVEWCSVDNKKLASCSLADH